MELERSKKTEFAKRAVSAKNLMSRVSSNQAYAKKDFNLWVGALLNKLYFSSVLDVCCGTGNQLVFYASKPEVTSIVGIDISKEALDIARERMSKTRAYSYTILKHGKMEEIFLYPEFKNTKYDCISCFYGLYYSQDVKRIINEMIDHLTDSGKIVIVGPYGKNNADLFSLLECHFKIPSLVVRSATTFMEQEVLPLLMERCKVEEENFLNPICYPDAESLIDYWKASTFYFSKHKAVVVKDIEDYFSENKEFIIEKHIKAYIGRKIK